MPDAKLKIKCLHDCKRVEEVMKNEDGPCKNSNRKNIAFHKPKFNQPIKHALYKTLVLSFHFPTTTSDGISCLLLLAVTLYCKNKSCA